MPSRKAQFVLKVSAGGRGRRGACLILVLLALGLTARLARAAGSKNRKLLFLVARGQLGDPLFERSVVLMLPLEDTPIEVGLILNKTSRQPLSKLFPESSAISARTEPIRFGGPVDVEVPGLIFHSAKPPENSLRLYGDVYVVFGADLITSLVPTLPAASKMLFFLGRAQWSPLQLQNEIHRGDWDTLHQDPSMIFTSDPKTLWPILHLRAAPGQSVRNEIPSGALPEGKRQSGAGHAAL
jgi:putative transcriptional regulator